MKPGDVVRLKYGVEPHETVEGLLVRLLPADVDYVQGLLESLGSKVRTLPVGALELLERDGRIEQWDLWDTRDVEVLIEVR